MINTFSQETPSKRQNWGEWVNFKREGVTRLQILKELIPKLQICIQTLQMALSTLPLRFEPETLLPRCDFPPALRAGSNRFIRVLDVYWRSPESGGLWYKSKL